jgi:hypothetical protein
MEDLVMLLANGRSFLAALRLMAGALLFSCLLGPQLLHATVIERVGFEELVAQSVLIFRGEALDAAVTQQGDLIYTTVTFSVHETLKGDAVDDTVALRFVGGAVGDRSVKVEGQFIPAVGDQGVYFVATTQQAQINPLSGWQQGYFPLLQNEQGEGYLDMRQRLDFIVPGINDNPLIDKMRNIGFSAEQIETRFPQALQFSWADFRAASLAEIETPTDAGVTP